MILVKQYNWLDPRGWDYASAEVAAGTTDRHLEAFRRITREPLW